jgi:hypothetical protein
LGIHGNYVLPYASQLSRLDHGSHRSAATEPWTADATSNATGSSPIVDPGRLIAEAASSRLITIRAEGNAAEE